MALSASTPALPSGDTRSEVLIVGAGPVGLTLALALQARGIETQVLDARIGPSQHDQSRAYLVAAGCWRIFEKLGIAGSLSEAAEPVYSIEADAEGHGVSFFPEDASAGHSAQAPGPLGYMIEASELSARLLDAVQARHIRLAEGVFEHVEIGEAWATATTASGVHAARLIVGCDGARSKVRASGGIRFEGEDYKAKAVSAFITAPNAHEQRARQIFLRTGPIAALPLRGGRVNLVWSAPPDIADALGQLTDAQFEAELQKQAPGFLPGAKLAGPRGAFPVGLKIAERFHDSRLALAGDSAHLIHPLAGQGLNLGLKDVAALTDVILDADRVGSDIGASAALAAYTRWRRSDVVSTAAAMDAFYRGFRGPSPLRMVAGMAMEAAGSVAPLRRYFTREAAGLSGDLPSLMRAEATATAGG